MHNIHTVLCSLGIHELKKHPSWQMPAFARDISGMKQNCIAALDALESITKTLNQRNDAYYEWQKKQKQQQLVAAAAKESRRPSIPQGPPQRSVYELPAIEKDDQWWRADGGSNGNLAGSLKRMSLKDRQQDPPQPQPQQPHPTSSYPYPSHPRPSQQYPNIPASVPPPQPYSQPPALPPKPVSSDPPEHVYIPPRITSHGAMPVRAPSFHAPPPPMHPPPNGVGGLSGAPPMIPDKPAGAAMVLMTDEKQSDRGGTTEGGTPLKTVHVPSEVIPLFLKIADANTKKNLETCGILCGKLSRDAYFCSTLVVPKQSATSDTCTTTDEVELFEYLQKEDLISLGWIHTHPTQTCFMSSVDLHTHCSYQLMLPEAIAIVLAPSHEPSSEKSAFHPHPDVGKPLYRHVAGEGGHVRMVAGGGNLRVVDLR
ncbi:hypothetical protein HK097_006079 [Rhizophlyctis rosea]|uniref:MPN domain-containing protein n=1 Tax=Rhizophlyctis rosea TaxID=64517 RepID=A0AAD5X2Y5_9FUNG|nr:hypothetical protein HK097_006079 [Rhizophlyctis rosea]